MELLGGLPAASQAEKVTTSDGGGAAAIHDLSPVARQFVVMSLKQLAEELPLHGCHSLDILETAAEFILTQDAPDALPRHEMIRTRITEIQHGKKIQTLTSTTKSPP